MKRKGFLWHCGLFLALLTYYSIANAGESADEITTMLTWWEEVGSTWDEVGDMIELSDTNNTNVYVMAENAVKQEGLYAIESEQ